MDATVTGLDPNNLPCDYSFDLTYDSSVLELQAAVAGALFDCGDLCFAVSSTSPGQLTGVGAFDLVSNTHRYRRSAGRLFLHGHRSQFRYGPLAERRETVKT